MTLGFSFKSPLIGFISCSRTPRPRTILFFESVGESLDPSTHQKTLAGGQKQKQLMIDNSIVATQTNHNKNQEITTKQTKKRSNSEVKEAILVRVTASRNIQII